MDQEAAFKYYKTSADAGEATGMNNVGWSYLHGIGVEKSASDAVYWFQEAASRGLLSGHSNLGWCLWKGIGGTQDSVLAQHHFEAAAKLGSRDAIRILKAEFKDSPFLKELPGKGIRRGLKSRKRHGQQR